jgi:hypothetical protein
MSGCPVPRCPPTRGAVSIVVAAVSAWILMVVLAVVSLGDVLVSDERAQSVADGAAHAAVGELIGDSSHDDIARLLEREANACWWAAVPAYAPAGAGFDDRCSPALEAAQAIVHRTPAAQLLALTLVTDSRDNQGGSSDAGRLEVLAQVAVDRGLPVVGRTCDTLPEGNASLCFAVATSGAQER